MSRQAIACAVRASDLRALAPILLSTFFLTENLSCASAVSNCLLGNVDAPKGLQRKLRRSFR